MKTPVNPSPQRIFCSGAAGGASIASISLFAPTKPVILSEATDLNRSLAALQDWSRMIPSRTDE